MKKIMIAFASVLVLAACGTGTNQATATDSTATIVDTTLKTDSLVVEEAQPTEAATDKTVMQEVK